MIKEYLMSNYEYSRLVDVIQKIYKKYPTGGDLHIVLDDLNVEDEWLGTCWDQIQQDKAISQEDKRLYELCISYLYSIKREDIRMFIIRMATEEFN